MHYAILVAVVLAINVLPAFAPPTWSALVYARLRWHLEPVALIGLGAVAATSGRWLLAHGARLVRDHFSARYRANLRDLATRLTARRTGVAALAALFVLSPLPSAQLFCAAGFVELPIAPLSGAFLLGRLVTYSIYVTTAVLVEHQLGDSLTRVWSSPWWVAGQVLLVLALAALPLIPWGPRARRHGSGV